MSPEFRYHEPLPSKDDHETAALTQERSLGDVVQPRSSLGPRFHVDRLVEFDATAPPGYPRRNEHDDVADRYFHLNDTGTRGETRARSDDNDDRTDEESDLTPRSIGHGDEHHDRPAHDERRSRVELVQRDRFERQVERERLRRERLERRRQRSAQSGPRGRRRASARSRYLDGRVERPDRGDPDVRRNDDHRPDSVRDRGAHVMPDNDQRSVVHPERHVGTGTEQLSRPLSTRLHGAALALYFALLPYVVLTKWQRTFSESSGTFIRLLLVVLVAFWFGFLWQVTLNVWRLRRGREVKSGGSAWLAGLLVALLALAAPVHLGTHEPTAIAIAYQPASQPVRHRLPTPLVGLAPMPLALVAKRRSDALRREGDDSFDVDESIELLRGLNPELIRHLAALTGDERDGVLDVPDEPTTQSGDPIPGQSSRARWGRARPAH